MGDRAVRAAQAAPAMNLQHTSLHFAAMRPVAYQFISENKQLMLRRGLLHVF